MKRKYIPVSVVLLIIVFVLAQRSIYGYGVTTNSDFIMSSGQVLGVNNDNNQSESYTYIIRSGKTDGEKHPTLTPIPTLTSTPSPTPIPTLTFHSYIPDIPDVPNVPTLASTQSPTATSYPTFIPIIKPTATPYPTSRPTVGPTARPNTWPTITPVPPSSSSSSSESSFNSSSSSNSVPTHIPTSPPEPTQIISLPPPSPTFIPEQYRGEKSTIVIEMPQPTINPAAPYMPASAPVTHIIKGEDVKTISINIPSSGGMGGGGGGSNDATMINKSETGNLDITLEEKQGGTFAVSQQEFVIQKGVQAVTISSNEQSSQNLTIEQDDTKARTTMSLSINPSTNILSVDTPSGPMKVSIMPGDAMAIMRQLKVIDQTGTAGDILLEVRDNQLQYKIKADKIEKLFGIIPFSVPRELYVAADTGALVEIKKELLYSFLSLFTF